MMEVTFAPALAVTGLTVTDTHVKVGTSNASITQVYELHFHQSSLT